MTVWVFLALAYEELPWAWTVSHGLSRVLDTLFMAEKRQFPVRFVVAK